ncbi:hypothetical protein [Bradyrhizobium sp. USDA 4473]
MSAAFSTEVVETKLLTPQLRLVSVSYPELRRGGGGRRDWYSYAHGATTMLAIGLVLNTLGIGLFCWAIFTLAVYALPFFVARDWPSMTRLTGSDDRPGGKAGSPNASVLDVA